MNAKTKKIVLVVLASVLTVALVIAALAISGVFKKQGNAKNFTVYTQSGVEKDLTDFQGKPIVVNFWATWCGPCKSELPAFDKMYDEYGDEVRFMMVNLLSWEQDDTTRKDVNDFIDGLGYDFPVYFEKGGTAAKAYEIQSIPLTVFIDEDGDIAYTHSGAMTEAKLEEYIKKLL